MRVRGAYCWGYQALPVPMVPILSLLWGTRWVQEGPRGSDHWREVRVVALVFMAVQDERPAVFPVAALL